MTCIRVIAILTLIRQLCKPILHKSKIKLHEFRANGQTFLRGHNEENALLAGAFDECRDNEKTCFRVSGHKLEVFICQIREEIRNPLTIVSYLLIKAAQRTGMLLNYKPLTSPQATSRRP